jgi:signal transduction histidine kinase
VLHEPNALFLGIFTLAGAAIVWPARITLPLVALLAGCYTLIIGQTQPANLDLAIAILLGFLSLMLGFECIGWVIRRFVRRSAQLSLEMQQTTNQQVRLEQQMADLHQHVKHITSLEHDLRQPLRSIQGNLAVLAVEAPDASDLLLPTIAATQRVDRLINNLLDLTRAEARQADTVRRPLDLQLFLRQLATTTSGLSRYYTAPPIPIVMECAEPITVLVDREQFERAILNVLDNALAYSPPDGSIGLRAVRDHNRCVITICDQGPGIPDQIVAALTAGAEVFSRRASRPCLGLRQVWAMAQSHHGTVECIVQNGTQIRLCLPDVQG